MNHEYDPEREQRAGPRMLTSVFLLSFFMCLILCALARWLYVLSKMNLN